MKSLIWYQWKIAFSCILRLMLYVLSSNSLGKSLHRSLGHPQGQMKLNESSFISKRDKEIIRKLVAYVDQIQNLYDKHKIFWCWSL